MTRLRKSGSGRNGRSSGASTFGWILLAVLALMGAGGAGWYAHTHRPVELDDLNCPLGGPTAATLVVLDLTDAVAPAQMRRIRQEIAREIDDAPEGAMIAVGTVRPAGEPGMRVFAACKPSDGKEASQLTQNPRMIRERYETTFLAPLNAELHAMASVGDASSSPIMETIQETIAAAPGWTDVQGRRRLVLASDLLQHSKAFSLYAGGDWKDFQATPDHAGLSRNLEGVEIEILRLPRPRARISDPTAVDDFWAGYFDRQGARAPRVRIVGDL